MTNFWSHCHIATPSRDAYRVCVINLIRVTVPAKLVSDHFFKKFYRALYFFRVSYMLKKGGVFS